MCRTVGPSLADFLEPLVHCQNVANISLFYRYYFGRCSSELAQLVPLPFSQGRSTNYSDRLHNFCVTIPRYYKDVYVNSFFPSTARPWNFLPIECFPLTYDLSGFKSRINRHPSGVSVKFLMAGETKCMVGYHLMVKDHSIQLGVWERGAVSPPAGARQRPGGC